VTSASAERLSPDGPGWLTPKQAADYLALPSRKPLYQAVRSGLVPGHRLGRLLRFYRPELDRVLLGRSPTSAPS
jgi:excisionase family DNA binding protein